MQQVQFDSSLIASAIYNRRGGLLDIRFRSEEVYRYFKVPPKTYEDLLHAESQGAYFNANIRNKFPYRRLSRPASPIVLAAGDPR
ncbi:MAG TPA: KTSC domain-containing protein [Bryobacteraceae bacterium]|nr:KTSC domain-containing protein [Bryobacteraceae bacterium]